MHAVDGGVDLNTGRDEPSVEWTESRDGLEDSEHWTTSEGDLLVFTDAGAVHATIPENRWLESGLDYTCETLRPDARVTFELIHAPAIAGRRSWKCRPSVMTVLRSLGMEPSNHLSAKEPVRLRIRVNGERRSDTLEGPRERRDELALEANSSGTRQNVGTLRASVGNADPSPSKPQWRHISVGTWNMDHWKRTAQQRRDAWSFLQSGAGADVMLLQESIVPAGASRSRVLHREIAGSRPWGTAVAAIAPDLAIEEIGTVRTRYGSTRFPMLGSIPGTIMVARVDVPTVGSITCVSVYG